MDDDPAKIAKAIRAARRCMRIIRENIAFDIANFLNHDAEILESAECFRVEVQETTGNLAIWES